jgi:hypothetical protein
MARHPRGCCKWQRISTKIFFFMSGGGPARTDIVPRFDTRSSVSKMRPPKVRGTRWNSTMQPTSWQLIRTNQWPRMDLDLDASGFYGLLERTEIETSTRKLLPHACDLFEEARFFIQLFASLEQYVSNLAAANWCVGAHFGAYISIDGAARYDIENLGLILRYWFTEGVLSHIQQSGLEVERPCCN